MTGEALLTALLMALWVSVEMFCIYKMGHCERLAKANWPAGDRWYLWRVNARQPWMWIAIAVAPLFYVWLFVAASMVK